MARGKLSAIRKQIKKFRDIGRPLSKLEEFMERQKDGCHYCNVPLVNSKKNNYDNSATLDHKVPYSLVNCNQLSNYVHCCNLCNNIKATYSYDYYLKISEKFIKPARTNKELLVYNLEYLEIYGIADMILRNEDYWKTEEKVNENGNT